MVHKAADILTHTHLRVTLHNNNVEPQMWAGTMDAHLHTMCLEQHHVFRVLLQGMVSTQYQEVRSRSNCLL